MMEKKNIRFLVMDVDGTLTDGKIYMGQDGELFKAFDIKDGCGIKDVLPTIGIIPIIITARVSRIVENRCKELGITELHQGCRAKLDKLNEILKEYGKREKRVYSLTNVAYIGDDILDLQCMKPIKENGGITACPADAVGEVLAVAEYICKKNAGNGAVRELINLIQGN